MRIKYSLVLLFIISGVFAAEALSMDSAIIKRNYTPQSSSAVKYTGAEKQSENSESVYIKAENTEVKRILQQIDAAPEEYSLYAELAGAYLKYQGYGEALDNFLFLYNRKKSGSLDASAVSAVSKYYSWYKRAGRKSSGLNLNLAAMSMILNDKETIDYLAAGTAGTAAAKNTALSKKVLDAFFTADKNPIEAVSECSRILAKSPDNALVRRRKAEYHAAVKQIKEAEAEYAKVLELNKTDDEARYDYFKILDASKSMDDKFMLKKLYGASENFDYEKAYVSMTELLMKNENYPAAKRFAAGLMKKYAKNPNGYIYTAEIYAHEGRVKEAHDILTLARNKADSKETAAKYNVLLAKLSDEPVKEAKSLIAGGLYEQASEVLESANPESLEVILTHAKADYLGGNKQSAFDNLNRAMSLYPDNGQVYCAFAGIYYRESDMETARTYADKALKYAPDNKEAQKLLDLINNADAGRYTVKILEEMEMQNYTEAMRLINEALEIDNKSADLYYFKSLIYIAQNNYQSASEELYKCIEINEEYADAYFYLAASFENLKEKENALKCYKKYISMTRGNELNRADRIEYAKLRISKLEQEN